MIFLRNRQFCKKFLLVKYALLILNLIAKLKSFVKFVYCFDFYDRHLKFSENKFENRLSDKCLIIKKKS